MSDTDFRAEIDRVFQIVQDATILTPGAPPLLTFTEVSRGEADITLGIVNEGAYAEFGAAGGVLAYALPPEHGVVRFDVADRWLHMSESEADRDGKHLAPTALHEILHALGIGHSDSSTCLMYPYSVVDRDVIDPESLMMLLNVYGWSDPQVAGGARTANAPQLVAVRTQTFTSAWDTLHLFSRGAAQDDFQIYEQQFDGNVWSLPTPADNVRSTHSPSLDAGLGPEGQPMLQLACKGPSMNKNPNVARRVGSGIWTDWHRLDQSGTVGRVALAGFDGMRWLMWRGTDGDQGLWWSVSDGSGSWSKQKVLPESGSSHGPALCVFQGRLWAFWKGIEGDSTMYFTSRGPGYSFWEAQRRVRWEDVRADGSVWLYPGTSDSPAVTLHAADGVLYLAWKGALDDPKLWMCTFDGNEFSGQWPLGDFASTHGPTLEFSPTLGGLMIAWRADDSRIVYATH